MKTLYAVVTYNQRYYQEVTAEAQRRAIERVIARLQYLAEIVTNAEGRINIS